MKKFLLYILIFFGVPLLLFIFIYIITDPFKNLNEFSLKDISSVNREYTSMELLLKNQSKIQYNSFIFGSSRACGVNTYYWKSKLNNGANQFLFQAWAETITGIYQKMNYLDRNNVPIDNALILIDIPSTFASEQESTKVLAIKDDRLSGKPFLYNQFYFFISYLKPTKLYETVSDYYMNKRQVANFDTISNDWNYSNRFDFNKIPVKNRQLDKSKFPKIENKNSVSEVLITNQTEEILISIMKILIKKQSNYRVVITPDYYQTKINDEDLKIIQRIFGEKNVFNFSGKNNITIDKYNFSDPNHFDMNVGKIIMDSIY